MSESAPIVFIASTCYDLVDLRAELRTSLEKDGFVVRLSDDFDSDFRVNPAVNSIESCLENLRTSDVALFIFDRRYGPEIPGDESERSATHIEFDAARDLAGQNRLHLLCFVRKQTRDELALWQSHRPAFSPKWLEKKRHEKLLELVDQARRLEYPGGAGNWVDLFEASTDLRAIARKRLYDLYPHKVKWRARGRDRVVRLYFEEERTAYSSANGTTPFSFSIHNAGINVALEVTTSLVVNCGAPQQIAYRAVLPVGARADRLEVELPVDACKATHELLCEYVNLWGDKYETRVPLTQPAPNKGYDLGHEHFSVVEAAN